MSIFGFSTEPSSGGDFLPIVKYDARAGRIFRVDRIDTGNGFESNPVDITQTFKALCDFENVEAGWIDFPIGSVPSFHLVRLEDIQLGKAKLPDRPSDKHRNGIRFMLKLAKDCGGDKPIREIAGVSKAFLSGLEAVYAQYIADKAANPGKLPVIMLEKTTPVTSGSGLRSAARPTTTRPSVSWGGRCGAICNRSRRPQRPRSRTICRGATAAAMRPRPLVDSGYSRRRSRRSRWTISAKAEKVRAGRGGETSPGPTTLATFSKQLRC